MPTIVENMWDVKCVVKRRGKVRDGGDDGVVGNVLKQAALAGVVVGEVSLWKEENKG